MFLQGVCDWEDSICNQIWIEIASEVCGVDLTDEELEEIRAKLDPEEANKKFHKLISDLIASKTPTAYLSSKGDNLAETLQAKLSTREKIPHSMLAAIDQISGAAA